MKRICVFCGSRDGARPEYLSAAKALGDLFCAEGIELVYGGASVGLMGAVANQMLSAGGSVTGVIPELLATKEIAHPGLTELRVVKSLHERKTVMADLADGFIALPGGFGTFEELCEILTWSQLGLHRKPIGILNVRGYYDPLLALFDRGVEEKFVTFENRQLVLSADEPAGLLSKMRRQLSN